jgi:hypothetical protein
MTGGDLVRRVRDSPAESLSAGPTDPKLTTAWGPPHDGRAHLPGPGPAVAEHWRPVSTMGGTNQPPPRWSPHPPACRPPSPERAMRQTPYGAPRRYGARSKCHYRAARWPASYRYFPNGTPTKTMQPSHSRCYPPLGGEVRRSVLDRMGRVQQAVLPQGGPRAAPPGTGRRRADGQCARRQRERVERCHHPSPLPLCRLAECRRPPATVVRSTLGRARSDHPAKWAQAARSWYRAIHAVACPDSINLITPAGRKPSTNSTALGLAIGCMRGGHIRAKSTRARRNTVRRHR